MVRRNIRRSYISCRCFFRQGPGGGSPGQTAVVNAPPAHIFLFFQKRPRLPSRNKISYTAPMTWHTLPFDARPTVKATEARLDAIYDAARKGLKGDSLALAAGLLPVEYRRLAEFDPLVEMAAQKGRADGEMEISGYLHAAAANGDTKAAIDILKHVHGWVARQAIDVTIDQTISVKRALEMAQQRVDDLYLIDVTPTPDDATPERPSADHAVQPAGRDRTDGAALEPPVS